MGDNCELKILSFFLATGKKIFFFKLVYNLPRDARKLRFFLVQKVKTVILKMRSGGFFQKLMAILQNQNQNSLLVKRQTDNTTPGGGGGMGLDRRGLVPSSHKRSKFRHTII